jgi:hypothetical protein
MLMHCDLIQDKRGMPQTRGYCWRTPINVISIT